MLKLLQRGSNFFREAPLFLQDRPHSHRYRRYNSKIRRCAFIVEKFWTKLRPGNLQD